MSINIVLLKNYYYKGFAYTENPSSLFQTYMLLYVQKIKYKTYATICIEWWMYNFSINIIYT